MKNILIFAGLAGLAAAIAIYFVTENDKKTTTAFEADEEGYVTDADIAAYDMRENSGPAVAVDDDFKPAY